MTQQSSEPPADSPTPSDPESGGSRYLERQRLIKALSDARGGTTVLTYVTSTRRDIEAGMATDAIVIIHEHLRELGLSRDRDRIDLLLHTDGGDGMVPWRLMTLLREYAAEVSVLVPHRCYSAGTLTALGADEVVMHPMGTLGPTDPTSHTAFNPTHPVAKDTQVGIAVEDVTSYMAMVKDLGISNPEELLLAFSILANQVHPLALGNVQRLSQQMEMMPGKMLALRNGNKLSNAKQIIDKLNRELFVHGHPINRVEARDEIGMSFVKNPEPAVEKAMWDLYESYASEMRMHENLELVSSVLGESGLPSPPVWKDPEEKVPVPNVRVVPLKGLIWAYVESAARSDCSEFDIEITAARYWNGTMDVEWVLTGGRWKTVRSPGA